MVLEAPAQERPDDVDEILALEEGKVERKSDPILCRHLGRQKCVHCIPIDPYDEEYLHSRDIKHMSFHAYVRKLTEWHGRGTLMKTPLENVVCYVKPGCSDHKPYPKGVCTKCRPSMVTLNRQRFRHVDNITFENEQIVDRFLDYWRRSGTQRIGYLVGRYETFPDVPLGIKAVVVAIYEPPQTSTEISVKLDESNVSEVDQLCTALQLKLVGWIFTDLWTADPSTGTVYCTRHEDSFLLSAEECITAAWLQNRHRNVTTYSPDGHFGSKFVTVVASGDQTNRIHLSGYQVSNQCSALVEADLLVPTDRPELAYLRREPVVDTQYLTDVQFVEKDEYCNQVSRDGRPLPVEYLLVDVPTGVPKQPAYTFHLHPGGHDCCFPVENRPSTAGLVQTSSSVSTFARQFTSNQSLAMFSDFHLLLYLLTNDVVPLSFDQLMPLCKAIKDDDSQAAARWVRTSESWKCWVSAIAQEQRAIDLSSSDSNQSTDVDGAWSCVHCTFDNPQARNDCSMCGLPKD